MTVFDKITRDFTVTMEKVRNWPTSYFGSVYSTRIKAAIEEARQACDVAEKSLHEIGEW